MVAMPEPLDPATIKAQRKERGWSQAELAHRLINATPEEIERFRQYQQAYRNVQNWEKGRYAPDPTNTDRLIRALTS
jgi:DNA-binding transcriptional regulator YiaG